MKNKVSEFKRYVNYYETDRMGIVHHSNYIRYFEEARLDMLANLQMDYPTIEASGIMIPVTFVDCQYLKPLRYGDEMKIESRLTRYNGIKMEVGYEIYNNKTGELCTTGKSGHCFLYPDMKPVRMKRDFPKLYQSLKACVEEV